MMETVTKFGGYQGGGKKSHLKVVYGSVEG